MQTGERVHYQMWYIDYIIIIFNKETHDKMVKKASDSFLSWALSIPLQDVVPEIIWFTLKEKTVIFLTPPISLEAWGSSELLRLLG